MKRAGLRQHPDGAACNRVAGPGPDGIRYAAKVSSLTLPARGGCYVLGLPPVGLRCGWACVGSSGHECLG